MDIFDLIWNVSQERQIGELRGRLDRLRLEHDLAGTRDLGKENLELKLRLGLLVRLLIAKSIITAEEYATLIADAS
jgi:hypothetical protein